MAKFTATVTDCPDCTYTRTAEMDDAKFMEILDSVRLRFGQVPGEADAQGNPVLRDMTNDEAVNKMLGSMLVGWTQNAATDKAEAARRALENPTPATWTIVA